MVRQLLTESFVLAALGGALGLLVAQWGIALLLALSPVDLNTTGTVSLSYPVLLFTATASLLTAIVCGLAPAFEGSRTEVQETLKDGARQVGAGVRHRRLRQAFVVSEIALAVVLLVGAGLMLRSFGSLRRVNPGYSTNNILTMRLQLPNTKYRDDAQRIRFFHEAIARIQEIPGVQAAGAISFLPLTRSRRRHQLHDRGPASAASGPRLRHGRQRLRRRLFPCDERAAEEWPPLQRARDAREIERRHRQRVARPQVTSRRAMRSASAW